MTTEPMTSTQRLQRIERLACIEMVATAKTEGQQSELYGYGTEILGHAAAMAAQIERLRVYIAMIRALEILPPGFAESNLQPGDLPNTPNDDGSNGR